MCVQGSVSVDSLKQEAVSLKFSHDELSLEKSPCSLNDIEICLTTGLEKHLIVLKSIWQSLFFFFFKGPILK